MKTPRKPVIAVIGAGSCDAELMQQAAAAGEYIARQGGVVICGGLGGVMEGAARGARDGNGVTIGIIPSSDRNHANEFIDYVIPSGMGEMRNALIVRSADAVLAFPGEYGTLSEMALALKIGKPVVGVKALDMGTDVEQFDDPIAGAKRALELARKELS